MQSLLGVDLFGTHGADMKQISDKKEHQTQNRGRRKLALAVPTVQQAWASSGVRAGDRIVAVNGTAGPAEKLLSLLRMDNKKRRLTLVRPQTEESVGCRESTRARRKLFV